jgi:hypothetical protein
MTNELVKKDSFDEEIDELLQPFVMVIFMFALMNILPAMQTVQQYYQSQQYEGQQDSRILSATSTLQHVVLANPWVGAFFINDGPGIVEIRINDESASPYMIYVNETKTISRIGAENRIYAIYYKCSSGGTATVRVDGVF